MLGRAEDRVARTTGGHVAWLAHVRWKQRYVPVEKDLRTGFHRLAHLGHVPYAVEEHRRFPVDEHLPRGRLNDAVDLLLAGRPLLVLFEVGDELRDLYPVGRTAQHLRGMLRVVAPIVAV